MDCRLVLLIAVQGCFCFCMSPIQTRENFAVTFDPKNVNRIGWKSNGQEIV